MRLTCPNCGAQYEVDASLIPAKGRDVQCSSCGHTWFQLPEPAEPDEETLARADREHDPDVALAGDAEAPAPARREAAPEPAPELAGGTAASESVPEAPPAASATEEEARIRELVGSVNVEIEKTETVEIEFGPEGENAEPREGASSPAQERPGAETAGTVPPSVAELLREEAERERRERERERASRAAEATVEAEPTDVADRERRAEEARRRVEAAKEAEARAASRFPDLEELNATLGGEDVGEAVAAAAVTAPRGRARYRAGFLLAILLFGGLFVIYLNAPKLVGAWPALRAPLSAYVETINAARASLADLAERLVAALTRLAGEG